MRNSFKQPEENELSCKIFSRSLQEKHFCSTRVEIDEMMVFQLEILIYFKNLEDLNPNERKFRK